ncbi:MAG TPA: sugar ABC transporter permease [Gaiellaceae bacterium]|nr:sugar ABC transporter permease [Gaiellaceae bacterium]
MSAAEAAEAVRPRRRSLRLGRLEPLVWITPALAVMLFVFGYAMVELVRTALTYEGKWAGLANFRAVLQDPEFRTALLHNARLLIAVPVLVVLALLLSLLLFESLRGWRLHRATIFLPYVLPIPVIGVIFGQVLELNGLLNSTLRSAGLGFFAVDWLGQPKWALWTMTGVIIWKEVGFGVVLFLARLLSLPAETFEAARIDGARFFRLHRFVTLPQITNVIAFYVVVEAITMVSWVFNYVYVMTNGQGGPGDATIVSELYIYQTAFQYSAPEIAAAAATILFGATLVLIVLFFRVQRRIGLAGNE